MLGKLQTYKLQPTKFYEKGHWADVGRRSIQSADRAIPGMVSVD